MTTQEALAYFDTLEPVDLSSMMGRWRGEGIDTGHYMDGLLEATRWYGKVFESPDIVHPLVHEDRFGGKFFVNPALLPLKIAAILPMPREIISWTFPILRPVLTTRKPKARLRMMQFRGRLSATMIYDAKPINDVFRKIDDQTVLGLMDQRGDSSPFFFKLMKDV
ncbi:DUF4334 domain-containing protein [uncultured Sulfitobacter sp.]|uniref:DUF4334 domain-containing protein n=1 Tax=uncultured Sulfitobacter sp. TaxID=191468 RepID=UPI0026399951|nr:DUF4334 domain-containing protein [uncultured Sulfitobacter sp.]